MGSCLHSISIYENRGQRTIYPNISGICSLAPIFLDENNNANPPRYSMSARMMNKFKLYIVSLIFFTFNLISGYVSADMDTVDIIVANKHVSQTLEDELNDKGIWYKTIRAEVISVKFKDRNRVAAIVDRLTNQILPSERSSSFPNEIFSEVAKRFDVENLEYNVVDAFDRKWIVWEEVDQAKAERIIESIIMSDRY